MDELKNYTEENENIGESTAETTNDVVNDSTEEVISSEEVSYQEDAQEDVQTENTEDIKYESDFYTNVDSIEAERRKEMLNKKSAFRKTVALGLVGSVLFGMSLGGALGVAYNGSRNLFVKSAQPFNFDTASEEAGEAETVNYDITPTSGSILETINSVQDSIVNISIVAQQRGWYNQVYESEGAGSGIIYSQDDEKVYIVTNNHVVADATQVSISITGSESVKASLVGKDATNDLAVISVLKSDLKAAGIDEVTTAQFGDSDSVQVGEYVLAIGNALGEGKTTTRGIISAQNKTINIDGKKMTMIQTDAAINPGNSGGALVNSAGQVIGINTAKYSSSAVEGTGFAIPANTAKTVIDQLVQNGTVDRPYLGIVGYNITDDFKQMFSIDYDGVYIREVEEGSAAEKAGLVRSDIIIGIDGVEARDMETLAAEIAKHKSGDTVTLKIVRNGSMETEVKATLSNLNEEF